MKKIDFTCPKCGAAMIFNKETSEMWCEYCGNRMMLQLEPEEIEELEGNKTETQKMQEKLAKEKAERKDSQTSADDADVLRGRALMGMVGIPGRLRSFFYRAGRLLVRLLVLAAAAALAFFVIYYLSSQGISLGEYYVPIIGGVLTLVGLFTAFTSRSRFSTLPLGLGLGMLAIWLKMFSNMAG